MRPALAALLCSLVLAACKEGDPPASDAAPRTDGGIDAAPFDAATASGPDANLACQPLASDYQPRAAMSALDSWPACITDSDANDYPAFDRASISTLARVAAFEEIASLLFAGTPDAQSFTDARTIYLASNGLESRVSRRPALRGEWG